VLYLVLILLLTFFVLTALLWGGTRLVQAALYEDALPDLYWRAPAAAAAVTAFIAVWALLNYRAAEPGQTDLPYDTLFNFTAETVSEPVTEFWAVRGDKAEKYVIYKKAGGAVLQYEYHDGDGKVWAPGRAKDLQEIIIKEGKDGETEVHFKPVPGQGRYVEEGGRRYLADEGFGRITTPRSGGAFVRVLLNVLHFVVWFAALWLLLRFQWAHALGLAAALWLVMTFVAPYILRKGAEAKVPPPTAARTDHPPTRTM
jgi:hypothetical protein